jgi:hypothetical protein
MLALAAAPAVSAKPMACSAGERGIFRLPALGHGASGGESRPIGGAIASMIVGVAGIAAVVVGRRFER